MRVNGEISEKLDLPDVSQIGIVVKDMDKAIEYYEKVLGLGPFIRPEIKYDQKFYYGKPVDSIWIMGFCSLGPLELELIQVITGPTIYHDFLKEKGEGMHHLGFDVRDIDETIALCKKTGLRVIQSGQGSTSRFAYLDTVKVGGVIFELIQRRSRRVYNENKS